MKFIDMKMNLLKENKNKMKLIEIKWNKIEEN